MAREANDAIAAAVSEHPDRFQGFATLPTPDPGAAADELRRGIGELGMQGAMLCGRTGERNMDQPDLAELYRTAAELHVPLYIHPRMGLELDRPLEEYFRHNVFYTGSGILSERYLRWTLEVVGIDRVMYSVDYPYIPLSGGAARRFLEEADLDPADREKIAHGNWERLTAR